MTFKLNHLAIIMDGNARWANKHNKTRAQGHKQGANTLEQTNSDETHFTNNNSRTPVHETSEDNTFQHYPS